MVFNSTFNNISVLLVEETRVPVENDQPVTSLLQTLSHIVVSSTPQLEKQNPPKKYHNYLVSDEDSWKPHFIWKP
jgi:hypothetical protein